MRFSIVLRASLCFTALLALLSGPGSVSANMTKEYVAKFTFKNVEVGQRDALSFEISGVLPNDVSVKVLPGSRLRGGITLDDLTTRTRVRIAGDVRAVNNGQTADVEIRLKNKKEARISDPRWGFLVNGAVPVPIPRSGIPQITGGKWVLDPLFTAFNDTDLSFGVRNLQLYTNMAPDVFEALDPQTFFNADLNLLLPSFFLSPGISTDDLGLEFEIFPEPTPGTFLVATGQLVDGSGNPVGGFIHGVQAILGVQAIPEPSTLALCASGLLGLCALASRRRRRPPG